MQDFERTVLEHYQLPNAYPVEWPSEKDLSDASEDEGNIKSRRNGLVRRSKSRYSALERSASDNRSLVPGSQKTGDGVENLVQRDEPDPLGSTESVVRILRQQGLPVQDDTRLRNRFLLSSTTFSPAMFLSQIHSTASTQSLLEGLDILSKSIDQKSASLKVLVESNFERFVRAKSTIDNVYTEMKGRNIDIAPSTRARAHSRHTSRTSFRGSSGGGLGSNITGSPQETKKKHALAKESEYGVLGIKTPLIDVSAKAEEVWGPALGGKEKEEGLKVLENIMDQRRECFEASGAIADDIKRRDYESLVDNYTRAKKISDNAIRLTDDLSMAKILPTDAQIQQIVLAARMWSDVQEQIETFKRDVWRRLIAVQNSSKNISGASQEQHMELISILLELGVQDNPIWVWLLSRYDHLKNKIQTSADRSKVEIEVLRRRLANVPKPTAQVVAGHLQSLSRQSLKENSDSLDSADAIELWERIVSFLNGLLSQQGILGEVVEFWQTVQGFTDGKTQANLPTGLNGESRQHHRLSDQGQMDLQKGVVELIDMIRESVFSFFADPPIEDISLLFSPIPPTPATPKSAALTPTGLRDPRFAFDTNNMPPPSPRLGESWEKFAFWPPWSNSVSGVKYLAKMLVLVGNGANEMATVLSGKGDSAAVERLRTLVMGSRERCVTAICASWNKDAENIKVLEDWTRSSEKGNLTRMPSSFSAFESAILSGMQKILYISEAMTKSGGTDVVLPPPAKLLQMVRSQFVTTLYKALSGMVENAEKSIKKPEDDWSAEPGRLSNPAIKNSISMAHGAVDASDRNVRMLLTLSNLQALRIDIVPHLIGQFESAFSVKLTDESKTIRDVLGQIDARLFQSYTRPTVESIRTIIRDGIMSTSWPPRPTEKPTEVRPYVYETLLTLVLIHTQVSTTASSLTSQVLSYLLEQVSRELLEGFRQRAKFVLSSLMQATLDVEFVAQTLSQYTTDRASELQSQIYQELDKGTDNESRVRLQSELPDMRAALKRLRDGSRSEFACFKKPRRSERPQT